MSIEVWYVRGFSIAPERTTFARETASFYIDAKGRRTKKESRWYRYFTSEQDAKAVIHARDEMKNQAAAKKRLEDAAPELLEALGLYVAVCGNTGHALSRESAAELHAKGSAAIAKARGDA